MTSSKYERDKMIIEWDKEPKDLEQKASTEYLGEHANTLCEVIKMSSEGDLLTASFTPRPLDKCFFTYEIRRETYSDDYLVIVWRGIRTGDVTPILYGRIEK